MSAIRRTNLAFSVLLMASLAHAHVTIWPAESTAGAIERYTVRVPTEGAVATASVVVEIPDNVKVYAVAAPLGWTYEIQRQGDRIIAITWTMNIKPGEFGEFGFTARNPADSQIRWRARQRFVDGTSVEWTGAPGGKPGPVTRLRPAPEKTTQ
jgi:uncharacterized protein YcnI